jgi:hypothetical protein
MLPRLKQGDIECREPMPAALHCFSECGPGGDLLKHPAERLTVRPVGGIAPQLLQCLEEAKPGASELAKLMIKVSAS